MKYIIFIILILVSFVQLLGQEVTVLDKSFNVPIPGVKVFSLKSDDTLETNSDGIVNINIFPTDQPVIFAFPPYFRSQVLKYNELEDLHYVVYLQRTASLDAMTPSKISAREYSEDLPFFVNIINIDENSVFQDNDVDADDKLNISMIDKGVAVFRTPEPKKMLIVIDGIPLNDELYANGKVEGLLSFEQATTDRIQKLYGASFTLYGSDATGGVIHYFTKVPASNALNNFKIGAISRYESANNSFVNNLNFTYEGKKLSTFTSIVYGAFGNIEMGHNRKNVPLSDSLYGLNNIYVQHLNDTDITVKSTNPYVQRGTNYNQLYFFQKLRFNFGEHLNLFVNFHYVKSSEIGIYSGMTEINIDHLRFAECEFMPQQKYIASANFLYNRHNTYFDFISFNSNYITYNEYRLTRKYNNPVQLHQIENIQDYNFHLDFVKLFNINRLVYGAAYSYNKLQSKAYFRNIYTDSTWQGMTRNPTNGSFSNAAAFYLGYRIMNPSYLFIDIGFRYTIKKLIANFDTISPQLPLTFVKKEYFLQSPVAAINFNIFPFYWMQLKLQTSYTVHFPIVTEFGRIMVKNYIVNIPNDNLKPEHSYNSEIGISFLPSDNFKIYGSYFANFLRNTIISKDTTLRGQDSLYFGKDRYNIATTVNVPLSLVYGFSGGFTFSHYFDLNQKISIKINGSVNIPTGKILNDGGFLPNISPLFGSAGINFNYYKISFIINTIFNGVKPLNELSPVGEDFIEKASTKGFLPWQIYNAHFSYNFKDYVKIKLSLNNIFDLFYIQYGTAIASGGRSFQITAEFNISAK